MAGRRIRVLVVDDSVPVQKILTRYLGKEPDIEVVGTATDPYVARDKILTLRPDVLTLDVEMPRMDGLQFLEVLMKRAPMPVVLHSSLAATGGPTWVRAMELGAVDAVWKPRTAEQLAQRTGLLAEKIRIAANAKVRRLVDGDGAAPAHRANVVKLPRKRLLVIGASTGGPPAVEKVIAALPETAPPTLIVQHMPKLFTGAFAKRLNEKAQVRVVEAAGGERLEPGTVYVAPGDRHLVVQRSGIELRTALTDGEKVHSCRPAVDILFDSVARYVGADVMAVVLTGMGNDGAAGLLALRRAGAVTIAQDEATCVVYGMPKAAAELGAVQHVLPLDDIAAALGAAYRGVGVTG
ncbi:MAG TPA: chemotaxis response regulator protein-glutamate methylesterase [Candidatus Krumholzibacteria bacterium]|nr:chemotaxis response regulator protein-glutamate methylesterase [Candidatus Krumholzibacteria bacterium]